MNGFTSRCGSRAADGLVLRRWLGPASAGIGSVELLILLGFIALVVMVAVQGLGSSVSAKVECDAETIAGIGSRGGSGGPCGSADPIAGGGPPVGGAIDPVTDTGGGKGAGEPVAGGFCPTSGPAGTTDPLDSLLGGSAGQFAKRGPLSSAVASTAKAAQSAGCSQCDWSDIDREISERFQGWRSQPGNGSSDAITDQYAFWCTLHPPPGDHNGGCSLALANRNYNIERGRIYRERGCVSGDGGSDFGDPEHRQAENIGCFIAIYSLPRAVGCIFLPGLPGLGRGGTQGQLPTGCDVEVYDANHDYCSGPNPHGFPGQ